jgi:hypothetical protein
MSAFTIMDSEAATLWFHSDAGIVHHRFKKPVSGDDFRWVLDGGLQLFMVHGASKWLSDDRANSALDIEDAQWAMNDWAPRVAAVGWEYWAIVLPKSAVGATDMARYIDQQTALGVDVQVFSDPVLALAWLDSV